MPVDIEDFEFAIAARFSHLLPREAAISGRTPRELVAALAPDSPGLESPVSLTVRAFYRIRQWVADVLDIDPRSVHPATRWVDLLPDHEIRRVVWAHFREMFGTREAPHLYRPRTVTWPIAFLASAAGLGVTSTVAATTSVRALIFSAGALVAGTVLWLLLRLTRASAHQFIPPDLTVGAVAHYAVAYGSPILGELALPTSRGQTLEVVQSLARLEIGSSRVHPDATWEQLARLDRAS